MLYLDINGLALVSSKIPLPQSGISEFVIHNLFPLYMILN